MKIGTMLVSTSLGPNLRVAVETPLGIVDATSARIALQERRLPQAAAVRMGSAEAPPEMIDLLGGGPLALAWVDEAVRGIVERGQEETFGGSRTIYRTDEVKLLSPVPRPPGLSNFSAWPSHLALHDGATRPVDGILTYWKGNADSFVGTGAAVKAPPYAEELDVECELAVVLGVARKNMDEIQAAAAIAGYTILNDLSARDIQRREMKSGRGPAKGKDFDGGNVLGPWIVTPDEIGDVRELRMSLHVNGEEWSSAGCDGMALGFPEMVAYLSQGQTLQPGHVVTSGCYAGGSAGDLGRKIAPGDVVELRISRIGALVTKIAASGSQGVSHEPA